MGLETGRMLTNFRVVDKLGEGGMGEVYRATDTKLDRDVAIKVLPEAVAGSPERLARFELEAKALAALNHPNIAGIFQVEHVEGVHFLVMELAEGRTLAEHIAEGPIGDELKEKLLTHDLVLLAEQGVRVRELGAWCPEF